MRAPKRGASGSSTAAVPHAVSTDVSAPCAGRSDDAIVEVMAEPALLSIDDLRAYGLSFRHRAREVEAGVLRPVRVGVYALTEEWDAASREERVVASARALHQASGVAPVFSHETAAALHGLPLYAPHPTSVHVTLSDARPGRAASVIRHRGPLDEATEVVTVAGLRCTTLTRTLADMARTATAEQSVTMLDAAFRRLFLISADRYDEDAADAFADELLTIVRGRAHGRTRAAHAIGFADGRAQLPGESVSRLRLAELGFDAPRLQVIVPAPGSGRYIIDFGLDDVGAWGEFDGRMKYQDGRLLVGRTADEVFEDEKRREDWIRGTTGRPVLRWGWPHISSATDLGRRLAAFGVRPAQ